MSDGTTGRTGRSSGTIEVKFGADALRQQADLIVRSADGQADDAIEPMSPEATRRMLHELRVHQIELEMQNEELRRTQLALDASRANYFDLYDLAPVGYCTVSGQGLILQANLTAAALLGVPRGALLRQPVSRFIAREDQDIYYLHQKQLLATGEPQSCELLMEKSDGTSFWAQLSTVLSYDDTDAPILRIALSDATARHRLDLIVQEKNRELERARCAAESANLVKSEFLSSMSHELRTPLSAILGFAQMIESGTPPPTSSQKRSIDQILHAGWYLLQLINEILDLALIESGKLSLSVEPVAVADLLVECETLLENQAQTRAISLIFSPPEPPRLVVADRIRLKQALLNLLSNAIKYNREGGSVSVSCNETSTGRLRISVRDTGEGLPPEKLAMLFQPFNRLGQEQQSVQGTGIGLVVCKQLVELMGGSIDVDSKVGEGSVFSMELNIAPPAPPRAENDDTQAAEAIRCERDPALRTLLCVEDNPANLMLVEDLIGRRPEILLLTARDGLHGVEIARAFLPDVILMDINLPGINGLQARKILAEDPATAHIPVIGLSANAMVADVNKAMDAGFFNYLTKPVRVDAFMTALDLAVRFASEHPAPDKHTWTLPVDKPSIHYGRRVKIAAMHPDF